MTTGCVIADRNPKTDMSEVRTEDVVSMTLAIHPGIHHIDCRRLTNRDIFACPSVVVTDSMHPFKRVFTIRVGMAEEMSSNHVVRVQLGSNAEAFTENEWGKALAGSLLIHQC